VLKMQKALTGRHIRTIVSECDSKCKHKIAKIAILSFRSNTCKSNILAIFCNLAVLGSMGPEILLLGSHQFLN